MVRDNAQKKKITRKTQTRRNIESLEYIAYTVAYTFAFAFAFNGMPASMQHGCICSIMKGLWEFEADFQCYHRLLNLLFVFKSCRMKACLDCSRKIIEWSHSTYMDQARLVMVLACLTVQGMIITLQCFPKNWTKSLIFTIQAWFFFRLVPALYEIDCVVLFIIIMFAWTEGEVVVVSYVYVWWQ